MIIASTDKLRVTVYIAGSGPAPLNNGIADRQSIVDMKIIDRSICCIAPYNTTLTVRYLTGGGAAANVEAGSLTQVDDSGIVFVNPNLSNGRFFSLMHLILLLP